jgi:hypothetical protein
MGSSVFLLARSYWLLLGICWSHGYARTILSRLSSILGRVLIKIAMGESGVIQEISPACRAGLNKETPLRFSSYFLSLSPLWRPAKLITVRFGPAPPSGDRVHDHRVRVGPRAVAIARPTIRGCYGDRRSGPVGRSRSPDIRPNSSASDNGSSNRNSCSRAAVFAPMDSPANPSNARCRKGPSDPGLSCVQRK